jgi:Putative zinc-finger
MEQVPKIVKERLALIMQANAHPDANLLAAFAEKGLSRHERAKVLEHLSSCAECREVVSLGMPESTGDSSPSAIARRSSWMSWPMLRWGGVAACVIVVGAAVRLHYQQRTSMVSIETPQSAPLAVPPPSPEASASNVGTEQLTKQPEVRSKREFNEKIEMQVSPERDRDVAGDRGRSKLLDRLEEKNVRIVPQAAPRSADKEMADEVAQLRKQLPAEKISQMAAAPPAASVPDSKAPPWQREVRKDDFRQYLAKSAAQNVTIKDDGAAKQAADSSVGKAKDVPKPSGSKETEAAAVGGVASVSTLSGTANEVTSFRHSAAPNPRWALSPEGKLQRSFDSGKTWQSVSISSDAVLQAIATVGSHVWVGCRAGVLYHSSDAGEHWMELKPSVDGQALVADVIGLEFTDALHGKLITKDETWLTSDGGQTWQKR